MFIVLGEMRKVETHLNRISKKRVKLVEEGGTTLESILVKSNPLGEAKCTRETCQICRFEKSRGGCQKRSVLYTDTCLVCEEMGVVAKYYGETSASCSERSEQHISDAVNKKKSSNIWVHCQAAHPDVGYRATRDLFRFEVVRS